MHEKRVAQPKAVGKLLTEKRRPLGIRKIVGIACERGTLSRRALLRRATVMKETRVDTE